MSTKTRTDHLQDLRSELLPGIHNEVTLKEIVAKVPWRDSHRLRVLNSTWQRAFRSGMVYDARVRSQATKKSFLALCEFLPSIDLPQKYKLYLHSSNQDCCYKLPPIPGYPSGLPYDCKCVPLDGKVYVLGGRKYPSDESGIGEVYVLDLAGQVSQWKQCKSMQVPRLWFGVSVMDGMIFVFGGESGGGTIKRCEKYDPKVDVWSEIQPSIRDIFADSKLYAVGKKLFFFDGGAEVGGFEGMRLLARMGDHPSDDKAENPSVNGDDDPSDAEEAEDPFISEQDSGDELHDVIWIKMIDPDLFRDDDSGNIHWFLEDVKFKHGFHQVIEEEGLRNFDEAFKYKRLGIWDDLRDVTSYVAYDTGEDKWREVENLSRDDLNKICLYASMQAPFHFGWQIRRNPFSYVETYLWPLNL